MRALGNGIRVSAWTFDEFYGRNTEFLDGLEKLEQTFVAEIPKDFRGWVQHPDVVRSGQRGKGPGSKKGARVVRRRPACEVRNLFKHSPLFRDQSWQRYRIKDTDKGPEVWEVKGAVFWRKNASGLPTRQHYLIVARNVLTNEIKYFIANQVPGRNGITLRWLLRVAFGRWSVESCFREAKDELGMDHYQVHGWRCLHRHFAVTQLSHLFCARMRQKYDDLTQTDRLTVEQVHSAINAWLTVADLPPAARKKQFEKELKKQRYHQRRNTQARKSHTKRRLAKLQAIGIDADKIKSCVKAHPR